MDDEIFAIMGVDSRLPTERPDIDSLYLLFWKSAGIEILWPTGVSPREAVIQWALDQIKEEEHKI